ncbi:hypothetical protein EVG20_g8260, partial [Dentipellis fragilis]
MSLTITLPPYPRETIPPFILRSARPNDSDSDSARVDGTFDSAKLVHMGKRTDVYRGMLTNAADNTAHVVICKLAFGKRAIGSLDNEANFYQGKLRHLQDVCIPKCYGYYIGDSDEGITACLVLEDCGKPVVFAMSHWGQRFKTAVLKAFLAIHDAGVRHYDVTERNILDHEGQSKIIDFEESEDHICERAKPIVPGKWGPLRHEFKCDEVHELCTDMEYWGPCYIHYLGRSKPAHLIQDAHALAATAPPRYPREKALQEAYSAIERHVQAYYPEKYAAWQADRGFWYFPNKEEVAGHGPADGVRRPAIYGRDTAPTALRLVLSTYSRVALRRITQSPIVALPLEKISYEEMMVEQAAKATDLPPDTIDFAHRMFDAAREGNV